MATRKQNSRPRGYNPAFRHALIEKPEEPGVLHLVSTGKRCNVAATQGRQAHSAARYGGAHGERLTAEDESERVTTVAPRWTLATRRGLTFTRLRRDLEEIRANPLPCVSARPVGDDLFRWHGNLTAPKVCGRRHNSYAWRAPSFLSLCYVC